MLRYAITDRTAFGDDEAQCRAGLLAQAAGWARADEATRPDMVQLREKDLASGALAELARELRAMLPRATKLLINARADVALAVAAEGVHLTSAPGSLTPAEIRALYAHAGLREPIVSVSCHTVGEVVRARDSGASCILFGPVFEKRLAGVLVVEGCGLELLGEAVRAAEGVPVLALGGVMAAKTEQCLAAGAAGVAGIRLFQLPWDWAS